MAKAEKKGVDAGTALKLWLGMLLPPAAWLIQLQTLWLTSEYGCFTLDFRWNHVASAAALLISAAGWFVAYTEFSQCKAEPTNDDDQPPSRRRVMSLVGLMTGALFTLLIIASWVPTLMGVPCNK